MFDLLFPKHWSTLKKMIWLKAAALSSAVVKTVTAAIVHIKDALAGPAQNVTIAIEPVQAGSGDPSPDNVRPISGWTGANVYRAGKNLIPASLSVSDLYPTRPSGGVCISATAYRTFACPIPAGASEITWSKNATMGGYLALSDALPTVGAACETEIIITNRNTWTFSNPKRKYLLVSVPTSNAGTTEDLRAFITQYEYCVNVGDSVDTGAPSDALTIPITFPTPPGTVYGGTLDVTTGVLTVTHASVDMGTLTTWAVNESYAHRLFTLPYLGNTRDRKKSTPISCSMYPVAPGTWGISSFGNNGPDNSIAYHFTDDGVWVRDDSFTTLEEFLAAVTGQTIVYELATPQTYQLTPQEVQLLAGENNIWADTGSTTLTYLADGRASDTEALGILLAGRYVNHGAPDEATDAEALDILLGGNR